MISSTYIRRRRKIRGKYKPLGKSDPFKYARRLENNDAALFKTGRVVEGSYYNFFYSEQHVRTVIACRKLKPHLFK